MTYQLPTRETLLNLTFETKAIASLELGLLSYRVEVYGKCQNLEDLKANLDLLEEVEREGLNLNGDAPMMSTLLL